MANSALMVSKALHRTKNEIFIFRDFITAVPAGATDTGDLEVPEGMYTIWVLGTQTAATTDPTFTLSTYLDAEKTRQLDYLLGNQNSATAASPVALSVAFTQLHIGAYHQSAQASGFSGGRSVHVGPGGIKWLYTKNGGTAIRLTLVAVRM